MIKRKTPKEKFLAWCEDNGIKFTSRKSGDGICYNINPKHEAVIVVQGVTLKMNKLQESDAIHVYFQKDGSWSGGTDTIWNRGLPWEK